MTGELWHADRCGYEQNYLIKIYSKPPAWVRGSFEIIKDKQQVYTATGWDFLIASIGEYYPGNSARILSKDITGDGVANLVVQEFTGRAHPVIFRVFSLGEEFRHIATIETQLGGRFCDFDNDGVFELLTHDFSYRFLGGWSHTLSPAPEVILAYKNGEYLLANELMKKPVPSEKEFESIVEELKASDTWTESGGPSHFYQVLLDLTYSGNEETAWKVFNATWPVDRPDKEETKQYLMRVMQKSLYYSSVEPS